MADYHVNLGNVFEVARTLQAERDQVQFMTAVTGAGISVASGLPLLEDEVQDVPLREFFAPELLHDCPHQYYKVYREALMTWRKATPNAAHFALAKVGVWIVTQNVDGLHWDAGSKHVIELHGNFRELLCRTCQQIYSSQLALRNEVPTCTGCHRPLEPGIVLEGQEIRHFSRAVDWVGRSQLLFVVGTMLQMDPVRRLPRIAKDNGAHVVWVNEEAERVLPVLCRALLTH
ncbi:Sir2 family NAD-dependent protein deacetylase [Alicyclobacillus pomorum]|jgi:NAD-dependent deacetylase|uniref:Sir2 family NAD-dependent protein deacetylase n=1 Tax=Alicyclobacillus pomorum TaxID=204470 RepID=UPI0004255A40|nr:Sir2 family NAD-dependent protein deacetylase [Alicyclobacillus pomorum]